MVDELDLRSVDSGIPLLPQANKTSYTMFLIQFKLRYFIVEKTKHLIKIHQLSFTSKTTKQEVGKLLLQ